MTGWILLTVFCVPGDPGLSIQASGDGRLPQVKVGLPPDAKLPAGKLTQDQGEAWLRLCLVEAGTEGPPIFGTYERRGQDLIFTPRFPLVPEKQYRAVFLSPKGAKQTREYRVPPRPPAPPARIVKIYPAGDVLPANHLRFFLYFSRPMRGGSDLFKHIRILDADGKEVRDPWLLDELWDDDGQMLILYIHPGRIKWDVLLRLLLGPVLFPDRDYMLVVSGALLDADGRRLGKDYTKKFRTTAEDRARIDLSAWKIKAGAAGSRASLVLEFPKALDHLSLERFLTIQDAKGRKVAGKIEVGANERSWKFTPAQAWQAEEYTLTVDGRLEDTAGNTPLRPFDVDRNAPQPPPQVLSRRFQPRSP